MYKDKPIISKNEIKRLKEQFLHAYDEFITLKYINEVKVSDRTQMG